MATENSDENLTHLDEDDQNQSNEDSKQQEFPEIFICLDDDDSSDYEEVNVINAEGEKIKNDDVTEFMDSLGLKGPPDSLELDILRLPTVQTIAVETKDIRQSSTLTIDPVGPDDLSHPIFQQFFSRDATVHFAVNCNRTEDVLKNWSGSATFTFKSTVAANLAKEELHLMRNDINICQGSEAVSKFRGGQTKKAFDAWLNKILLVKNIGDSFDVSKLKELFPDADIVVHKEIIPEKLTGQAYLLYETKERSDAVLKECNGTKLELNGQRLLVFRCSLSKEKVIPEDMLRLGERLLVLNHIKQTKSQVEKSGEKEWLTNKLNWLGEVICKDDKVRTEFGLPRPSHENLSKMKNIRKYNDADASQMLGKILAPYKKMKNEETNKKLPDENNPEEEKSKSTYPSNDNKRKSEKGKYDKSESSRSCQVCGEVFQTFRQLKFHMQSRHSQDKGKFVKASNGDKPRGSKFSFGNPRLNPSISKFGSSARKRPISLLDTPFEMKRSSGNGLLGARPPSPPRTGRNTMLPSLFSLPTKAGHVGNTQSLLGAGSYPNMLPVRDDRDVEPFRKVQHMNEIEMRDRYSQEEARHYSSGYGGETYGMDSYPTGFNMDIRGQEPAMRRDHRLGEPEYQMKLSASAGSRIKSLFETDAGSYGRTSSGARDREDFRRPDPIVPFRSTNEERVSWRNAKKDNVSRVGARSSREFRQAGDDRMDRESAKSDPVSLLLNLSQLLAEKMQRDRDRP